MEGSYNIGMVALSFLIATLASYTTIELSFRTRTAKPQSQRVWLLCGALAAGTGIWAMHFVGMLAYSLPIPLGFDPFITFYSWCAPIFFSAFALKFVQKKSIRWWEFILSSALMGSAITGMHYIGMFAMRMAPPIKWNNFLVSLSILIAVVLSGVAIATLRHLLKENRANSFVLKVYASLLLGIAICAMHYTGMWAAHFPSNTVCISANQLNSHLLPTFVSVPTVLFLIISSLISYYDRRRIEQETLSETDQLTGLKNRRFFQKHLPEKLDFALRMEQSLHLVYLDLDGFKLINDDLGHEVGDEVLNIVSTRVQECLREQDQLIRMGGDEFVLILINLNQINIANILDRILLVINHPLSIQNNVIQISGSMGVAHYQRGILADSLLTQADMAMYHAKHLGRNRWYKYDLAMESERIAAAEVHRHLRSAIDHEELKLFYQPKFACGSRCFVGVEALIRWYDPPHGWRYPNEFIPVAEKTGLINRLGEWVLHEACRQVKKWQNQGHQIKVSVNVSAHQIREGEFASNVKSILRMHEIQPSNLTIEITESMAVEGFENALHTFQELQAFGVTVSLDDFGTGYSSLSYLRKFPATELKIDRSFVVDINQSSAAKELLKSIIVMGHALGMTVVAEGVEDESTALLVEELGCDLVQGYHFCKTLTCRRNYGITCRIQRVISL